MKLTFSHNTPQYENDLAELVRGFFPSVEFGDENFLKMESVFLSGEIRVMLTSDIHTNFKKGWWFEISKDCDELERKRLEKRYLKIALYRTLSFLSNTNLPYGCLTGIRPTKLYAELGESAGEMFRKDFSVSENKVKLVEKIIEVQTPIKNVTGEYDVFINIPFCPSRCSYCSFVSVPIDKQKQVLKPYVECLIREIKCQKELIKSLMCKIRAVYIGGGTPTSLPPDLLKMILKECDFGQREFTVEAGRPDTLNRKIVGVLKKAKVNRISVNPQTFHDKTLQLIGRHHTVKDTIKAFKLVKRKFDVNMDLIAMLPNESLDDFKYSVDSAIKLHPENITVHTLYLKRGSELKQEGYRETDVVTAKAMVDYACEKLMKAGYLPYYMYRQKYTTGNLENVGYALPRKECLYNIDIMEEDTSIFAIGAGAIAKKYTPEIKLIERFAHCKEPSDYVSRFEEMNAKNQNFWKSKQ
ncbi:MAG TPA: coproporphyrinogen dehydrogenase HemZ [Clostridia bacterium]|nr:coproporphyrinogen dehydrogenase HemZ [Clostridia bacterium]